MNRQEERRLTRLLGSKKAFIEFENYQRKREKELVIKFLGLCMEALHDEFGFGDVRLRRFGERVEKKLDCINADYVTFSDILENLNMIEK